MQVVEGGNLVKKLVLLATAALVAMLILVPIAMAQELPTTGGQALPVTGRPSLPLPVTALLFGLVALACTVLRRR